MRSKAAFFNVDDDEEDENPFAQADSGDEVDVTKYASNLHDMMVNIFGDDT